MRTWSSQQRANISAFKRTHRRMILRSYWVLSILLMGGVLSYAFTLSLSRPDIDVFVARDEVMARYRAEMRPFIREAGRIGDFAMMYTFLQDNWPYFDAAERAGYDVHEIAYDAFNLLVDEAFDGSGAHFLWHFMEDHFFSQIPRMGDLRIVSEELGLPEWITQPYFFGLHDWRFDHDNIDVPTAEAPNFSYNINNGTIFAKVRSFLPYGYRAHNQEPYWLFDWDHERARVHDFFMTAGGAENIVLDIRGNADGFYDYFIQLLLPSLANHEASLTFSMEATDGDFAQSVLNAFRTWYNLSDDKVTMHVDGGGTDATVWVVVCDAAFSGPNSAYIALAQSAGIHIVLDEDFNNGNRWGTSFFRLPYSRLTLRFNPLAFRWDDGRLFEEYPAQASYTLDVVPEKIRTRLPR